MTPIRFLTRDLEECHLIDPDFDGGFLDMINVEKRSKFSGKLHTRSLDITQNEYDSYITRKAKGNVDLIQNEFPDLSYDDREFIMTGGTPEEWREMFPDV
jgi:hypothetical protein